jgi:hypothetical protein
METYSVYITTNLLSPNKAYVGMTNGHNPNYMGSDKTLNEDIKLLGRENFTQTFLGTFDNWQECHYWEGFYVRTLKTHVSQGGYNKSWTGGSSYIVMTKKIRNKIRKTLTGKHLTEEHKNNIGLGQIGNTYMLGKHLSEEHKKHISDKTKGVKKRIVICPHCGKSGGCAAMKIYHFDNCKLK